MRIIVPLHFFLAACSELSAPPIPSPAFTLRYVSDAIPSGDEGMRCLDLTSPPVDTWVSGWHVTKSAVHHVNVWKRTSGAPFSTPTTCQGGWHLGNFLLDSSKPDLTEALPQGYAVHLPPSTDLLFDVHYLNATTEPAQESVTIDFLAGSGHAQEVSGLVWLQAPTPLALAPGATKTVRYSAAVPASGTEIVSFMAHEHVHGTAFSATVNGAQFYETTSYAEPPLTHPLLTLSPSDLVTWSCTFANTSAAVLEWGTKLATSEMCQVVGLVAGPEWIAQPATEL